MRMTASRAIPALLITLFALSALLGAPAPAAAPADEPPPILRAIVGDTINVLADLERDLRRTAAALARIDLRGSNARSLVRELGEAYPFIVDCATVDERGVLLVVEPAMFSSSEGADVAAQEHIKRLRETKRPVVSALFRAVECVNACVIAYPIVTKDGVFRGAVSLLIRPEALFSRITAPRVAGVPVDVWVMQTDGVILYDPDREEVGRTLTADPVYEPFPELVAAARTIAGAPNGAVTFSFRSPSMKTAAQLEAQWETVDALGTSWRVVLTRSEKGRSSAARRSLSHLGLVSCEDALRALARSAALQDALSRGEKAKTLEMFKSLRDAHPWLYAVQWADEYNISRFGYPPENSLSNYDLAAPEAVSSAKTLEALKARRESFYEEKLMEGRTGKFHVVPVSRGGRPLGAIYTIELKE